jgi:anti-sigma28 factor (negative regulator of flagellin synthesis)
MKKKLLTKEQMYQAGTTHNYYLIMEEYLRIMPFTAKERSEVKTSLLLKIEYAFSKNDKKITKKLDKRMKELIKEIDARKKIMKEEEELADENFIAQLRQNIVKRDFIVS